MDKDCRELQLVHDLMIVPIGGAVCEIFEYQELEMSSLEDKFQTVG